MAFRFQCLIGGVDLIEEQSIVVRRITLSRDFSVCYSIVVVGSVRILPGSNSCTAIATFSFTPVLSGAGSLDEYSHGDL